MAEPAAESVSPFVVRRLHEMSRDELAVLCREYLLAGQLMDRAGMPHVIGAFGREIMGEIAIDEWMGASPIYTRRIQQLLGFAKSDVETIFKGMQFDIGAPSEFMDFRYRVTDSHHGEFWLDHCGALMDVEPLGDEYVTTMCHDIEDPTFDATATATNPRARMSALHRPPREPADREPHCHWQVVIDESVDPLPDPEQMTPLLGTRLVGLPVPSPTSSGDGRGDYSGPIDPDLRFEVFSKQVLVALLDEFALQSHLLVMSLVAAIERQANTELALEIVAKQFVGSAAVTAERLKAALGLGDGLGAIAQVIEVHPAFRPSAYVDLRVEYRAATGGEGESLTVRLFESLATAEVGVDTWIGILADGRDEALAALVAAVDPLACCVPTEVHDAGELRAWKVEMGDRAAVEPSEVALTRFSTGSDFVFGERPIAPTPVTL